MAGVFWNAFGVSEDPTASSLDLYVVLLTSSLSVKLTQARQLTTFSFLTKCDLGLVMFLN
jgi:hypothetical protein